MKNLIYVFIVSVFLTLSASAQTPPPESATGGVSVVDHRTAQRDRLNVVIKGIISDVESGKYKKHQIRSIIRSGVTTAYLWGKQQGEPWCPVGDIRSMHLTLEMRGNAPNGEPTSVIVDVAGSAREGWAIKSNVQSEVQPPNPIE